MQAYSHALRIQHLKVLGMQEALQQATNTQIRLVQCRCIVVLSTCNTEARRILESLERLPGPVPMPSRALSTPLMKMVPDLAVSHLAPKHE